MSIIKICCAWIPPCSLQYRPRGVLSSWQPWPGNWKIKFKKCILSVRSFFGETGRTIWWEGDIGISLWQGFEPSIWQNYYVYDWPRLGKYLCDSLSDTDKGWVNGIAKALRLVLLPKQMQGESKAWFYRTLCLEHALWGFAFLQLYWGLDRVFHKKQSSFLWPGDLNLAVSICKEIKYQNQIYVSKMDRVQHRVLIWGFYKENWPKMSLK